MVVEKVEEKKIWQVTQVAVQTEPVLTNTKTGEVLGLFEGMAKLLNEMEELKIKLK